jgi:hypothetical protein
MRLIQASVRALAALLSTAATSSQAAVQAKPELFDQFSKICLATGGGAQAVAQAATGWVVVPNFPQDMLRGFGGPFESYSVRGWRSADGKEDRMLVQGIKSVGSRRMNVCTLSGHPSPTAAGRVSAWAGSAQPMAGGGADGAVYLFSGQNLPADPAAQARVNAGDMLTLTRAEAKGVATILSFGAAPSAP